MYYELIQPVLWGITLGSAAVLLVLALRNKKRKRPTKNLLIGAAVAGFLAILIVPAIGIVPPGHRGVVYKVDGGIASKPRGEGVTFLVPWLQHMTNVSVRTQKVFSSKVYAQSKDLQEITVVASVNYHIDPKMAAKIYQRIGPNYESTVIQPALFQRTKAAVGQIKAEDFAKERDKLADGIAGQLTDQLKNYGLVVEFVNIEDAIFDPDFVRAVKNKIIAQQQAEQQKNLIAAARAKKTQTIVNAQAQAQSVLIKAKAQSRANTKIAKSVTPALIQWQYFVKWNGILPSTILGSNTVPFFNAGGATPTGPGSGPGYGG